MFKFNSSYIKPLMMAIFCLFIFVGVSCVCASSLDDSSISTSGDNVISVENTPVTVDNSAMKSSLSSADSNIEKNSTASSYDTRSLSSSGYYHELRNDIQRLSSGDSYNFTKDYNFKAANVIHPNYITIKANNVTINGKGHVIYAAGETEDLPIFKVLGDNVKILNLTFINSYPRDTYNESGNINIGHVSPVVWDGNNGILSNCTFKGNHASFGGAMSWNGNNGTIKDCVFEGNTAKYAGGAIYVKGNNLYLENVFVNGSYSEMTGEGIFFDKNAHGCHVQNLSFNVIPFIDGRKTGIDFENICYSHIIQFTDKKFDLVSMIYRSVVLGGVLNLGDGISFYAQYFDGLGQFSLTISRDFGNSVLYTKSFAFENITDFNDVFIALKQSKFTVKQSFIKTVTIANDRADKRLGRHQYISMYNNLAKTNVASTIMPIMAKYFPKKEVEKMIEDMALFYASSAAEAPINLVLKVMFKDKVTINTNTVLNLKDLGYTLVVIDGHGSTICGNSYDWDDYKWVILGKKSILIASNLTVTKFNTALDNSEGGIAFFDHMVFDHNRMDYLIQRDWGAAILNKGFISCTNCVFSNNYAKNGGAIFNQGILMLSNTTFSGNQAYGVGNDVCNGKGGQVIVDGKRVTDRFSYLIMKEMGAENITCNNPNVYFAQSMSQDDILAIKIVSYVGAAVVGVVVGFATLNPVAGILAGGFAGAILGTVAAACVISKTYDMDYDREKAILVLTGGSAFCGVVGGCIGVSIHFGLLSFKVAADSTLAELGVGGFSFVGIMLISAFSIYAIDSIEI